MPTTALIILNYNNWEDTMNCVASVEKYNTARIKYIVVDNGSPREGTVEALDRRLSEMFVGRYARYEEGEEVKCPLPYMTLLVSKVNDGYACGNNKGLRIAYGDEEIDYVMILNNDTLFIQDIIPGLVEKYPQLDKAAIISPLLLKKDGTSIDYNCARRVITVNEMIYSHLFFYFDPFRWKKRMLKRQQILLKNPNFLNYDYIEADVLSGSCMLLDKKVFMRINGFDTGTFLYNEENILYQKFSGLGYMSYVMPQYKCIHLGASSTKKSPSLFILKVGIASATYYLENYSGANRFQRLCYRTVTSTMMPLAKFKMFIFRILGIKKGKV